MDALKIEEMAERIAALEARVKDLEWDVKNCVRVSPKVAGSNKFMKQLTDSMKNADPKPK